MGLAPRYRENSALSEHETKPDGFGLGEREDSPPQECPGWDVLTPRATRASKKRNLSPNSRPRSFPGWKFIPARCASIFIFPWV